MFLGLRQLENVHRTLSDHKRVKTGGGMNAVFRIQGRTLTDVIDRVIDAGFAIRQGVMCRWASETPGAKSLQAYYGTYTCVLHPIQVRACR
jgi:hypothetical protein